MGLLLIVAMAVIGVIMVKNNSIKRERNAQLEKLKAYEIADQNKKLASTSEAQKDSINFYKLETDVYTLLEVHDPASHQLSQMDSIAGINPDSLKMRSRIRSIINSEAYKKAVKGNH